MISNFIRLDADTMKISIIPMPDGRFFIPANLVEPMYAHGYLDAQSYYRFIKEPKTLDLRSMTLVSE